MVRDKKIFQIFWSKYNLDLRSYGQILSLFLLVSKCVSEWVSDWVSEWLCEWLSECVSEWVSVLVSDQVTE